VFIIHGDPLHRLVPGSGVKQVSRAVPEAENAAGARCNGVGYRPKRFCTEIEWNLKRQINAKAESYFPLETI
jgi:hypothetical protein